MVTIIDEVPQEFSAKVAYVEDTLYCCQSLRSEPLLQSFVSLARKRGLREDPKFIPDEEFQKQYQKFLSVEQDAVRTQVQKEASKLIENAYNQKATDIHITDYGSYGTIQFRRLGMLTDQERRPGTQIRSMIYVLYGTMCSQQTTSSFSQTERQEARIADRAWLPKNVHSVRVHTEPIESTHATDGLGTFMALRLLYDNTSAAGRLEERLVTLGYGDQECRSIRSLTERSGLTIISGPTGSGKSTTLKHVMEAQSFEAPEKSYMSIEDPPEYPLAGVKQIKVQTQDSKDSDDNKRGKQYTDAIAGAMRSDPDTIMIGEIRYPEAAVAAIDAALTGHAVFATLHANNAFGIISRMTSLLNAANFLDPLEYLCDHNVLAGLIYQRLVPRLCPHCKIRLGELKETYPDVEVRARYLPDLTLGRVYQQVQAANDCVCVRGKGCENCDSLGISSQSVVAEVVVTDEPILRFIRDNKFDEAYTYWAKNDGKSYTQHAIEGIQAGLLDPYLTELRMGVPLDFRRTTGGRE